MTVGDGPADPFAGDVVGALGHLRRQHAGHGAGFDRGRAAAVGIASLPGTHAEARGRETGETKHRLPGEGRVVHVGERSARP